MTELNEFQKDVLRGACVFCGRFRHPEYENLTGDQLKAESTMHQKMDVMSSIHAYGDQQGRITKMGCIAHELKKRREQKP